jgi:hypothetical protein
MNFFPDLKSRIFLTIIAPKSIICKKKVCLHVGSGMKFFSLYAKCAIYSRFVKVWLNPEKHCLIKNGKAEYNIIDTIFSILHNKVTVSRDV